MQRARVRELYLGDAKVLEDELGMSKLKEEGTKEEWGGIEVRGEEKPKRL